VTYEVPRFPQSVACRPFALGLAIYAGKHSVPVTATFRLAGTTGSEHLATPPRAGSFEIAARTITLAGVPSKPVTTRVR
jgi:hypothetical protein